MDNKEIKKERKTLADIARQAAVYLFVVFVSIIFIFVVFKWNTIVSSVKKLLVILAPVIAGLVIAYILLPIVDFFEYKIGNLQFIKQRQVKKSIQRGIAVGCALGIAIAIIFILGYMILPQLVQSISQIILRFPSYSKQVAELFNKIQLESQLSKEVESLTNEIMDYIQKWMSNDLYPQIRAGIGTFTASMMNVLKFFYNVIIGAIISIYVLMSKERFTGQAKKFIYAVFRPNMANACVDIVRHSNQIFGGFISGKLIDSAIIGVICFISLKIMNMPYTMLVSVIVGVTNIIPFFGPYIGAVPSFILISLTDFKMGVIFLIFIVILQQIDGNILGPKILGNSTGLSPFWVVFSILIGSGFFGLPGMILGVPVFAVFYYLLKTFVEYILYKKHMPIDTNLYVNADGYDEETGHLVYTRGADGGRLMKNKKALIGNISRISRKKKNNKTKDD